MTRKIVKLSLQAIVNHKMRSFLTMLGIIIGVMAVVILVSITQSAATGITSSISDMGSQLITASVTSDEVSLSRESVESLAGTGAISLLVGGIGIMNIMLVSVTERTREIGIRKAVGAKRRHILLQFLCESCILSLLGGAVGLGLSFGVVAFYNLAAGSSASLNWAIGGAAILFCGVIGILFGSYPAAKASRLQPIEALHTL